MSSGDPRPEMAYQMALSQLAAQFAAVDELRARVGVVLSGAAIATGFLAGQALNTSVGIPGPAWLGISAGLALIVCSAIILWPREWDGQTQDADVVLRDVEAKPDRDMVEYYATLAGFAMQAVVSNRTRLRALYSFFSLSLGLMVLDFAGWIWTLAVNNGGK
jgi:hypothetical protein